MRYFIRGYYGNCNVGDELMLRAIVQDLRNITPNCEIDVLGVDCETAESLTVRPVSSRKESIAKSDLMIIGGGNLLYDRNRYGRNSLWSCIKEVIYARFHGTKVLFYGVGVGPIVTSIGKLLMRMLISLSEGITVRDPDSYSLLLKCGVNSNKISQGSDLVFRLTFNNEPPVSTIESLLRNYLFTNKQLKIIINVFNLQREQMPWFTSKEGSLRRKMIAALLDRIISNHDAHIIFVAAQGQVAGCDYLEAKRTISLMKHKDACINLPYINPEYLPSIIKLADIVIAMRLHISILAFSLGIIPVGLSYSDKVRSFYKMGSLEKTCFEVDNVNIDELYLSVSELLQSKNLFKTKYQSVNRKLSESAKIHPQILERVISNIHG